MEAQIFHMEAKTIKIILLLLVVIFGGGFSKNEENSIFVETENGQKAVLKNFYFGLKKTLEPGTLIKKGKTSDGTDFQRFYGGKFLFIIQDEIKFKLGIEFWATWFTSALDKNDQIILKVQIEGPSSKINEVSGSEITSFNKIMTHKVKGADYIYVELESGDPVGKYKIKMFNKENLVASKVFLVRE